MDISTLQLLIRQATPQDVDSIITLTDEAYSRYIPLIGRKPQPMTADYSKMVVDNTIWLLEADHQVLGVLVLINEPESMLIYSIAIRPNVQKQGLGHHLLDWAEKQARLAGYKTIRLYTNAFFADNIKLYSQLGYEETGHEPLFNSTLVHMSRNL